MKVSRARKPRSPSSAARCEQRREDILEAAVPFFARHGYAADLQELADQLEIGKGTIYRYFGSKQDLFLAAADLVMQQLRAHIDRCIEGIEDPLEHVTRGIHAYLEYFDAHPEAVEIFIQEQAQFRDRKRPTYFEHREANIERWRNMYRQQIAQGRIRPIPVERISDVIGDLLYGAMFVSYIAGRRPPTQVAEDIIDLVFNGILSDAERNARSQPTRSPKV